MSECPFYKWNSSAGFFGSAWCMKQDEAVDSKTADEYCKYSSHTECPYFKSSRSTSSGNSGCFLTTACVVHKGLPDDCRELTTMRRLRDEWLVHQPGGQDLIDEYYRIAPGIVEKVNARNDAPAVWEHVYREFLVPCVEAIEAEKPEKAVELYEVMVHILKTVK